MHDFIKTNEIYLLENEINYLEKKLDDKIKTLREIIKIEFEKQFNLKEGKTILKYEKEEYIYADIENYNMLWIGGFPFNKDGMISLLIKKLYDKWEHTGKEYNNGTKGNK